uniref:7TM_GPCR_Srx domain-containing protein n=1 Tax=Strongyloides venezuelensis TaxID=75913 RepID=A0A0K0G411_STRVS
MMDEYNYNDTDEYNFNYTEMYDYFYDFDALNEVSPRRPNPPRLTKIEIGLFHLILPFIFIVFQSIILIIFYKHSKIFESMPYKIMKHQGQILLIKQLGHFCTSFIIFFSIDNKLLFVSIIGSMINGCYIGNAMFILLITINRLLIMYRNSQLPIYVDRIFIFSIFLCYLCAISFFIFFLFPSHRIIFDLKYYEWYSVSYIDRDMGNKIFTEIQNQIVLITLGIASTLYLLIFLRIIFLRLLSRNSIIVAEDAKFLLYAILNFFSIVFLEIAWSKLNFYFSYSDGFIIVPQFLYIFVSGSNTIFTFCFVSQVRKNIFRSTKPKKKTITTKIRLIRY